jgi:hypothetical protein
MYNKLWNKQDGFFLLVGHVCIKKNDQQISLKGHKNHLISSSHVCFMATFPSFVLSYNVNNNSNGSHKLQGYSRFI